MMTSEEYVDVVNMMMENQDRYFNWFLVILGIFLIFVGVIQWRFSIKQIEQIKEKTKQETIREIEETLGVSNLYEFKKDMQNNFEDIENKRDFFESAQFDYELNKLYVQDRIPLWHITYLMDIYKVYILKSFTNFDYVVSRVSNLIFIGDNEKKLDINLQSDHIDNIIWKMAEFEKNFNEKSEKLKKMRNEINFYRNQEE